MRRLPGILYVVMSCSLSSTQSVARLMPNSSAARVEAGAFNPVPYLERHAQGDWGDQGADGWALNDAALGSDYRILSMYDCPALGERVYVETDGARQATTV